MTASPGREVEANLLRGAALESAQTRAQPQDAGGEDLGDLVEALGRGHEVGTEGVGHVRVAVLPIDFGREAPSAKRPNGFTRQVEGLCPLGSSAPSGDSGGSDTLRRRLSARFSSARFRVDRRAGQPLCSGYVLGRAGPGRSFSKPGSLWMLEARVDRAAVPLRAAVSWILFQDFSAPGPVEPCAPWHRTSSDRPSAEVRKAREQLLVMLRDGDLHGTGRYSDTPSAPWEAPHVGRHWMMHSGRHTQVLTEHWRAGRYSWQYDSLDLRDGQYIDVQVPRFMIVALWPPQLEPAADAAADSLEMYTTPYLDLMRRAIVELRISANSQPKKDTVMAWFREQTVDHQPLSENFARHLATFVRLPESQRGGNRKWRFDEADRPGHFGP
jgi:hypothetical protein